MARAWTKWLSGERRSTPSKGGFRYQRSIVYTSGTTGVLRRRSHTRYFERQRCGNHRVFELSAVDGFESLPVSVFVGCVIISHHLACGATLVLENHFVYPRRFLHASRKSRSHGLLGSPTFSRLLECDLGESISRRSLSDAGRRGNVHTKYPADPTGGATRSSLRMYGRRSHRSIEFLSPDSLVDKLGSVGRLSPSSD